MLEHLQYGIDKYSSTISFFFMKKNLHNVYNLIQVHNGCVLKLKMCLYLHSRRGCRNVCQRREHFVSEEYNAPIGLTSVSGGEKHYVSSRELVIIRCKLLYRRQHQFYLSNHKRRSAAHLLEVNQRGRASGCPPVEICTCMIRHVYTYKLSLFYRSMRYHKVFE